MLCLLRAAYSIVLQLFKMKKVCIASRMVTEAETAKAHTIVPLYTYLPIPDPKSMKPISNRPMST